jgi:hypothetical protein
LAVEPVAAQELYHIKFGNGEVRDVIYDNNPDKIPKIGFELSPFTPMMEGIGYKIQSFYNFNEKLTIRGRLTGIYESWRRSHYRPNLDTRLTAEYPIKSWVSEKTKRIGVDYKLDDANQMVTYVTNLPRKKRRSICLDAGVHYSNWMRNKVYYITIDQEKEHIEARSLGSYGATLGLSFKTSGSQNIRLKDVSRSGYMYTRTFFNASYGLINNYTIYQKPTSESPVLIDKTDDFNEVVILTFFWRFGWEALLSFKNSGIGIIFGAEVGLIPEYSIVEPSAAFTRNGFFTMSIGVGLGNNPWKKINSKPFETD